MSKSDFNERREARKSRYEDLSVKNEQVSEQRYQAAKQIGDHIPFGQPILVGHHSERRHRSDLNKIDNNMRKSVEADDKAKYYAEKAKHIEQDNTIYSDDPDAIAKLKAKIDQLEKGQHLMKEANKIVKSKKLTNNAKIEKLVELGYNEKQAAEILVPDYAGRIGFPSYSLTNNNANIRRNKQRLVELIKQESEETKEYEINGVKIVDNVEDNRLQIFFEDKPEFEVRKQLKSRGFRWSPRVGAWQRHRSSGANYAANEILKGLNE